MQSGGNAPTAELVTPNEELINAVLTPEDQECINNGTDIKIILKIEDATENVPSEDKAAVEKEVGDSDKYNIVQYLDVTLLKKIGEQQEIEITNTNSPIKITFDLPEDIRSSERTYSVIRVHNGETTVLSDLDNDDSTVTIETDKFSTYALVYSEKSNDTQPAESSSDGNEPTPPAESSSDSNEPIWPVESGSNGNELTPPTESSSDSSNSASSESEPTENGNTPSHVSGEASGSESASPSEVNPSTDESNTDTNGSISSSNENSSVSNGSVAGDNEENPSTGIVAVSLVPLATAITVLAVTAKRKKK